MNKNQKFMKKFRKSKIDYVIRQILQFALLKLV